MLIHFFYILRAFKVPVTIRELLDLHDALSKGLVFANFDDFYELSRVILVKNEQHFDRFDKAYAAFLEGALAPTDLDWLSQEIPDDWLRQELTKNLSDEELEKLKRFNSLDEMIEEFKKRLEEQEKRHQGGNKWIGTGGTSPFGHGGHSPEGMRVGGEGGKKRAVKVWEKRQYRDLDDSHQLGIRNMKMALRKLRRFIREGAEDEFDLDGTIQCTAENAGLLDIQMRAERKNRAKVLLFFDVGGSMDPFIQTCEALFSAARTEFNHLEYFYFHNFIYESVWQDNSRRFDERIPLMDVIHKYGKDYSVIFVGDAAMSPYEINSVGGSVEHWNEEPGAVWFQRFSDHFDKIIWINPEEERYWQHTQSTVWIRQLVDDKMYPMTLQGLEEGMRFLASRLHA